MPVVEVCASACGTDAWDATEAAINAAKAHSKGALRVNLTGSFVGIDDDFMPEHVECSSVLLAELGADIIMLMDDPHSTSVGAEEIACAVEDCLSHDRPATWSPRTPSDLRRRGVPMDERIGIRAQPSMLAELGSAELRPSPFCWQEQVEQAVRLRVRHYDYCPTGLRAPHLQPLLALLQHLGVRHEFAPSKRQQLVAGYKRTLQGMGAQATLEAEYERRFGQRPLFSGNAVRRRAAMRAALLGEFVKSSFLSFED